MSQIWALFSLEVDQSKGRWRTWLIWFARVSFVFLLLFISIVSLVSGDTGDVEAMGIDDKIAHILAYAAIMGAGLFSVHGRRFRPGIFVLLLLYGAGLELGQQFFADDREGSILDAMANLSGLVVGLILSKPMGYFFCWLGPKWFPERR